MIVCDAGLLLPVQTALLQNTRRLGYDRSWEGRDSWLELLAPVLMVEEPKSTVSIAPVWLICICKASYKHFIFIAVVSFPLSYRYSWSWTRMSVSSNDLLTKQLNTLSMSTVRLMSINKLIHSNVSNCTGAPLHNKSWEQPHQHSKYFLPQIGKKDLSLPQNFLKQNF